MHRIRHNAEKEGLSNWARRYHDWDKYEDVELLETQLDDEKKRLDDKKVFFFHDHVHGAVCRLIAIIRLRTCTLYDMDVADQLLLSSYFSSSGDFYQSTPINALECYEQVSSCH